MMKVWTDLNTALFSSSFRLTEPKISRFSEIVLPLPTRNLELLNSFKSLINTKNTKLPAHYYVGCRLGQILHARLRTNCSALNAHLFIRNLESNNNTKRLNTIEKVKNIM
jgi:hypothetical protein